MLAKRPDFLIIGAQKCGTSWLHTQLSLHPDIFLPRRKELEFFSYKLRLHSAGIKGYLENFQEAGSALVLGEATASYFWSHGASPWCVMPEGFETNIPLVVKRQLGAKMKMIAVLRHPARRAISAYLHHLSSGEIAPTATFEESMAYNGIVDMGFYARHLTKWLEVFDLSQIMVLNLENDIQARPAFTMSRLYKFLGVEDRLTDISVLGKVVYGGIPVCTNTEGVFADLGKLTTQQRFDNAETRNEYTRILSLDQWKDLESIYAQDVAQLDSLLGTRLLSDWGFTN